jgi:hypothetical protein
VRLKRVGLAPAALVDARRSWAVLRVRLRKNSDVNDLGDSGTLHYPYYRTANHDVNLYVSSYTL